jgi:hypothetical protein
LKLFNEGYKMEVMVLGMLLESKKYGKKRKEKEKENATHCFGLWINPSSFQSTA